ncbi:hypothetical protein [Vibrio sp. YIC-376]|uniref:hypothetical protein n=1 Tax=Vibrio sp. YIC-376 TaxID=3136162 RepID=UPI00402A9DB8
MLVGAQIAGMVYNQFLQGAAEGAPFIQKHLINRTEKAFDDFASGTQEYNLNRSLMGLDKED